MSSKWREGLIPRKRIEEYARMLLGPYRWTNDQVSASVQMLIKMLNEQHEKDIADGRARAEKRRDRQLGLGDGQDGYIRPHAAPSETSKALAGDGPDWKQRLAQAFFGKQMADKDKDERT